jgi:hypothetical protein
VPERSLDAEQKDVAAVLASAALEDCLEKYATLHGQNVDGKSMQEIVGTLKAKGLVSGAQKTLREPRVFAVEAFKCPAAHAYWGGAVYPSHRATLARRSPSPSDSVG